MNNCITAKKDCQDQYVQDVQRKLAKLQTKKAYNKNVVSWLAEKKQDQERADAIHQCATFIEFERAENTAQITKANFCRQRLCHVCAWRRQAKFLSQMTPILDELSKEYLFVFATLTVKNAPLSDLSATVDNMMIAYNKLLGRKRVQQAFAGCVRSLELTYNPDLDTFHPHIHILIAVRPDYYYNPSLYVSQKELVRMWQSCLGVDYVPVCHIEGVRGEKRAEVEVLKYSLKPSKYETALEAFGYVLKGRRLVSFSGIFAKYRKQFDREMDGTLTDESAGNMASTLCYRFDVTGGVYKFFELYNMKGELNHDEVIRINESIAERAGAVYDITKRTSEPHGVTSIDL